MDTTVLSPLLYIYGTFLIACGIVAVSFIGLKAKTALLSGGISGCIALFTAYLYSNGVEEARWIGLCLCFGLSIVFSWRTTKTLFSLFEMIQTKDEGLKGKGVAFLIIGLMAIVTLLVLFVQLAVLFN